MNEVVWAEFHSAAGRLRRCPVRELHGEVLEGRRPVWQPVRYRGKRAIATWWRPADAARHAGCAHLTAYQAAQELDFDPQVTAFGGWPLRLSGAEGDNEVVPDFFARLRTGQGCLVVCPPGAAGERGEGWLPRKALLEAAANQAGWRLWEHTAPDPVVATNRRRLARYRHPRWGDAQAAPVLREVFARPLPLLEGVAASGFPRLPAVAHTQHLIWTQQLLIDWRRPFTPKTSLVWAAKAVA